jgi:hypothetical protein
VVVPDIVGSARRTLEVWHYRHRLGLPPGFPYAFVAQDGCENLDIPWDTMDALFIGGRDPWKDSQSAQDMVKTAKTFGIHVHVGRVNTKKRYELFAGLGADTCDGSGVAMYDHMIEKIVTTPPQLTLFNSLEFAS